MRYRWTSRSRCFLPETFFRLDQLLRQSGRLLAFRIFRVLCGDYVDGRLWVGDAGPVQVRDAYAIAPVI